MINQAIRLLQNRDFRGAARLLEKSLISDLRNPQLLTFLGYTYLNLSQPDKALEYVLAAQKIDDKIPLSHEVEGDIYLLKNEPIKAYSAFFQALVLESYDQVLMEKFKRAFDDSAAPETVDYFPVEGILAHCQNTGSPLRKFDTQIGGQSLPGTPFIAELETVHAIGHSCRLFSSQMTYLAADRDLEMINRSDIVSVPGMRNIIGCSLPTTADDKPSVLAVIPAKVESIESCIVLNHRASDNYFHWLLEVIPCWEMIESIEIYKALPVLVNAHMPDQHYQVLQQLLGSERQLIRAKVSDHYLITKAVIPLERSHIIFDPLPNISLCNEDMWFSPLAIEFLRQRFTVDTQPPSGRKILLTRNSSTLKKRKLLNNEQVEQIFRKFNFELIDCGTLTFAEQVALFQSANIIAGATGASFTNLVFSSHECKVLLMAPEGSNAHLIYENLARSAGQTDVYTVVGQSSESTKHKLHADFTIDCVELERMLSRL